MVPDLASAAAIYRDRLGAQVSAPQALPEHGVTVVFVGAPNSKVELMAPLGEASPVAGFLARNPAGGLHHICFEVPDVRAARDRLTQEGGRVLGDGEPRAGAHGNPVLFLHPKDFGGVLIELEEVGPAQRPFGVPDLIMLSRPQGGRVDARPASASFDSGASPPAQDDGIGTVQTVVQDDAEAARHKAKMANRKAVQDAEVASKTVVSKGLLIVNTGPGKGKSTAAFGLVLRALGQGWPVGVVQFIKGAWDTGERRVLERFPDQVRWFTLGEGFTWETQDKARDIAMAQAAWAKAQELMADPEIRLLVLDELNIALRYDYLPLATVVAALEARRPDLHVVVTGRNAKPELIEAADLVTEMTVVKHHFKAGVKAQAGIEF